MFSVQLIVEQVLSEEGVGSSLEKRGDEACQSLVLDRVHAQATIVVGTVKDHLFWFGKHILVEP